MEKARLRRELQNSLFAIPPEQRLEKSRKACQNLISMPRFQDASTIMMYLSLPYEADISEAILHAWQFNKTVAVPKISWEQRHMIPVKINSLETGISTGASGLKNPVAGVPVPFEDIDLVVTPALGFDRHGNRLGRGGSYYDRFFANTALKASRCGFAFAEQIIDSIPVAEHDEPVDSLVTDEGIMYFNHKGE
ncbi:MAG: 5-formyltetrahydrofolate cyclo-ligase [Sedimentisphaerales bacterium]|nr:5-formyltetrahydrofolate cyclo-ligase [Sedimentisphaerales bacterium]